MITRTNIEINWIDLPGGQFVMGLQNKDLAFASGNKKMLTEVRPFKISRYPITIKQFLQFYEETGKVFNVYQLEKDLEQNGSPEIPAGVTFKMAYYFAQWVGAEIPNPIQWEYACRAGTETSTYTGKPFTREDGYFVDPADTDYRKYSTLKPVNSYPPNPWGLYDMFGNRLEWCWGRFKSLPNLNVQTENQIIFNGTETTFKGIGCGEDPSFADAGVSCLVSFLDENDKLSFRLVKAVG